MATARFPIRVSDDKLEELKRRAADKGVSLSALAEEVVTSFLAQNRPVPKTERVCSPTSVTLSLQTAAAFEKAAKDSGVPLSEAMRLVLEEYLAE